MSLKLYASLWFPLPCLYPNYLANLASFVLISNQATKCAHVKPTALYFTVGNSSLLEHAVIIKKNKKKIKNNKNPAAQNACYRFLVQVCFEQRLSASNSRYSGNVTQFLPHSLEPRVLYKEAQMFISLTTARSCCQHISLFQEKNKHKYQVYAKFSPKQLSPCFLNPSSLTLFTLPTEYFLISQAHRICNYQPAGLKSACTLQKLSLF